MRHVWSSSENWIVIELRGTCCLLLLIMLSVSRTEQQWMEVNGNEIDWFLFSFSRSNKTKQNRSKSNRIEFLSAAQQSQHTTLHWNAMLATYQIIHHQRRWSISERVRSWSELSDSRLLVHLINRRMWKHLKNESIPTDLIQIARIPWRCSLLHERIDARMTPLFVKSLINSTDRAQFKLVWGANSNLSGAAQKILEQHSTVASLELHSQCYLL